MFSWIWFFVERFLQVEALDNRVFFSTGRPENSVYLGKELVVDRKTKKKKNSSKVTFGFSMKICTKLCSTRTGFLRWLHLRTMWSVAITTVSFLSLQFGIRNEKCFQNRVVKRFDVDGVFQNGFFLLNFCFEDSQHCKLLLQFVFLWLQIVGRVSKV
jgi:hypothetical protein